MRVHSRRGNLCEEILKKFGKRVGASGYVAAGLGGAFAFGIMNFVISCDYLVMVVLPE